MPSISEHECAQYGKSQCVSTDTQICSNCKDVWYCGTQHQKKVIPYQISCRRKKIHFEKICFAQDWPAHRYRCHPPSQMGLYISPEGDKDGTTTPLFLPVSTGSLDTLPRDEFSALIPNSSPSWIRFRVLPISTIFAKGHTVVIAYSSPRLLSRSSSASPRPLEINQVARKLASPFVGSKRAEGLEDIRGPALLFYLEPRKDYIAEPDHAALLEAGGRLWDSKVKASVAEIQRIWKQHIKIVPGLFSKTGQVQQLFHFDAVLWPALHDKPRIVKVTCALQEQDGKLIHALQPTKYLGSSKFFDSARYASLPSRGDLPKPMRAYFRDEFVYDGSPLNQAAFKVTNGQAEHTWKGNLLLMREPSWMSDRHIDVKPVDVNISIEWLIEYGKGKPKGLQLYLG
jgi:hypothetical protein